MPNIRKVYLLLLLCIAATYTSHAQGCDTASAPVFTKSCFTEYFTNIHATGDMGTVSTISVNATSCTGTYTDLSTTQGITAPVGAHVYLHISRYTTHYTGYVSVYVDWDRDNEFESVEFAGWPANPIPDIELGPNVMDSVYEIGLFCGAPAGRYHMRVMLSEALINNDAPCTGTYGQAYDFYYNSYCPNNTLVGDTLLCSYDTVAMRASYGCGVWSSSNAAVVSVGATGIIGSGSAAGTAIISYRSAACGTSSAIVTVAPATVTMPTPLCLGGAATATSWPSGGSWTIGSGYVATISATGATCNVTAAHAGSTTLSYSFGGCSSGIPVDVLSTISISGDAVVCLGNTKTLTVTPPGGTWSSSNAAIASVNASTGVVSGVAPGTVTITYVAPYGACVGYKTITVEEVILPTTVSVCAGNTVTLTATPTGGTWVLDPDAEGMTLSSTGVFYGSYFSGPDYPTVTYTSPAGCQRNTFAFVEERRIWLPGSICIGFSAQVLLGSPGLAGSYASGITLASSNTVVATVNGTTGMVTGVSAGTAVITYTSPAGCIATATVAVGATPVLPSVTLCTGATTTFSYDGVGTWVSNDPLLASVDIDGGVVTGLSAGSTYISFTPSGGGAGCAVVHALTVGTTPTISGSSAVCQGGTTTYTTSGSGYWSSSNTARATVSSGGVVTGITAGTAVISHTSGFCVGTKIITVTPYVSVSGCSSVCAGTSCTITTGTGMSTYGSSNTGVATVTDWGGAGVYRINGISAGTATITFGTGSCAIAAFHVVTVNPTPNVTGPDYVCPGTSVTLSATPGGGTWSSDNTSILTINSTTGVVSYVSAGGTSVDYVSPTGCSRSDYTVTAGATISLGGGALSLCKGTTVSFTGTPPGGLWESSDAGVLSIDESDGSAHGNDDGTATLTYTAGTCSLTRSVTVKPKPRLCKLTSRVDASEPFGSWGAAYTYGFAWLISGYDRRMRVWGYPAGGTFTWSPSLIGGDPQTGPSTYCHWPWAERITLMRDGAGTYGIITYTRDGCSAEEEIAFGP